MEVEFAAFLVTANGVKPTKKMTEAILHFPTPMDITDVRSWFGFVNQVSYAFSQVMAPFRERLRSKNQKFYWNETLERLFRESKRVIVQKIEKGVKTFKINRPCLATDYSKTGICFVFFYSRSLATVLVMQAWITGMTTERPFKPDPALPMIQNRATRRLKENA